MSAYILQMLFFALSIFSVAIMVVMILKDVKATKKQWWALLLPILLLFMTLAYRFDWSSNITSDLNRWFRDFDGLKRYGFDYEMHYADEFSVFWKVIAYVFCHVDNLHWLPLTIVAIDFGIFFYILSDMAESKGLAAHEVVCCLILRLSFLPLIMSISACRNVLAYSLFSLGYFIYYKRGWKNLWVYIFMLLGVLTHSTVFLAVSLFVLSVFVQKYKKAVWLFLVVGLLFAVVIAPSLAGSSNEMFNYFGERWDMYLDNPNSYEIIKSARIMTALLPLFLCIGVWYAGKGKSNNKDRISYIVANMAATISVYSFMPELFLRMCYPTAMLNPVLWSEIKATTGISNRAKTSYALLWFVIAIVAFLATFGAWFWEIYWFFEI